MSPDAKMPATLGLVVWLSAYFWWDSLCVWFYWPLLLVVIVFIWIPWPFPWVHDQDPRHWRDCG